MCSVTSVRHVEDCFDGDFIKEFELDCPLNKTIMRRLACEAELQFYPDFPKPYFRIYRRGVCTIQGVLGKKTFRVTFSRSVPEDAVDVLKCQIMKGDTDGS